MKLSKDEHARFISNIISAADELDADATVLFDHEQPLTVLATKSNPSPGVVTTGSDSSNGSPSHADENVYGDTHVATEGIHSHVLIRQRPGNVEKMLEIRVAVVGNVDAGKSTLLGVLTKDVLDDGRGKARVNLFRHKHEIESGRTSSIGLEILGFDSQGKVLRNEDEKRKLSWEDICARASKVISFSDLAGHERYLKTTVFGLTGCTPDYVMLMVGSNAGFIGMSKEHLGLAICLNLPVFIVVTKIDMAPANVLESTITQITKILKSAGCRKIPMFVKNEADVVDVVDKFVSERICPIFQVSNVTGVGLPPLLLFLNLLHSTARSRYHPSATVEYQITDTFSVPGVGTVVSGTLVDGTVRLGDTLLLGPDSTGHFVPTMVKGIQRKRVNVSYATAGQSCTFALKKIKRSFIRKGMVLLSKTNPPPQACREFEAEVVVLFHSTTIGSKYQAMLHSGCIRQTARIVDLSQGVLRTGDRANVRFRFIQHPEYLKPGARLLFREGRTKGVGKVIRTFNEKPLDDGGK
ncbi:P-loop containing nucleoside triphosphate hydrolase protein [Gonapodya prolifera JEL478]|uniref:p-loop containing nucleoside triphosphate hydrolase protein n=1 Tax=Gonapodya prolifera (strain JEL478) TaxID=1344416 RepID=A0A139AP37_GONPJ|nr:P-loop containing nucleoside triphosphate hydrolase protein [Gonapodya prolifera JEL478]|eukprot:KXS18255.1 P-loop containing nucleoside triphosphate hydrolase protein [Gonapodya prolifera JEL478]